MCPACTTSLKSIFLTWKSSESFIIDQEHVRFWDCSVPLHFWEPVLQKEIMPAQKLYWHKGTLSKHSLISPNVSSFIMNYNENYNWVKVHELEISYWVLRRYSLVFFGLLDSHISALGFSILLSILRMINYKEWLWSVWLCFKAMKSKMMKSRFLWIWGIYKRLFGRTWFSLVIAFTLWHPSQAEC